MSEWTHPICEMCWCAREGSRQPARMRNGPHELCCNCGEETSAGIYFRADPKTLRCDGKHPETGEGLES